MVFEVPETGHISQFFYNAVEGKHFLITSEEDPVRIEMQPLINDFGKRCAALAIG